MMMGMPNTQGLVVKVLLRNVPKESPQGEVALEVYKAIIVALGSKYGIMGYSWESE